MKNLMLVIKGFVMGIANIIPGVSGGTLALTLGIYENFIGAISHFFKNIKENIKFLIPVFIGMGLSILTMSNVVSSAFDKFPLPTTTFFMGLVIGGLPMLIDKVNKENKKKEPINYVIMACTFILVMLLAFSNEIFGSGMGEVNLSSVNSLGYFLLLLVGMIAAATMVIPGVSGSLVLMLLGYYLPIVNTIKDLTHFNNIGSNLLILIPFGIGVVIGIVLIAKLIEWLFQKHEKKTYYGVIGFILASVIAIPVSVHHEIGYFNFSIPQIIFGIIFLVLGLAVGYKLGEK